MAGKSEVYTWRVSPETKAGLEEAARNANRSVAQLLDEIVADHLTSIRDRGESDSEHQRRLHARAARFLGCIHGQRTERRSERVRELVRERLKRRYARSR
jgi:predicted DNA-binding protein